MRLVHLTAGARGRRPLVIDDTDRRALLAAVRVALRAALLAYCIMDTHLHVVAEGIASHLSDWLTIGLHKYTRAFNRRHALEGPLLRGPVAVIEVPGPEELARTIYYVHENPVNTHPPLVERAVEYPWSSRRAYFGLCRVGAANVPRAAELLRADTSRMVRPWPAIADLTPSTVPIARPETLLAAASQVFGCDPADVAGPARGAEEVAARTTYVNLGRLEAFMDIQLAETVGLTRSRISQIGRGVVDEGALRIARTLVRDAQFRRRLPHVNVRVDYPPRVT